MDDIGLGNLTVKSKYVFKAEISTASTVIELPPSEWAALYFALKK
jgi:hypothetical protein